MFAPADRGSKQMLRTSVGSPAEVTFFHSLRRLLIRGCLSCAFSMNPERRSRSTMW
jgi:hypothetical protein